MKQRKSKPYLIISSAHLGVAEDIVKVFAQVAKFYKAEVYHLGATITEKEMKQLLRLDKKTHEIQARIQMAEYSETKGAENRIEKLEYQLDDIKRDIKTLEQVERERVQTLVDHFGTVNFVTTENQHTNSLGTTKGVIILDEQVQLSKYMCLSALQPSGDRTVIRPVTTNAKSFFKRNGKSSWVSAHPVPSIETTSKPGLNEAHKYYTVGALKHITAPTHSREFFQVAHMPCALLILMDIETEEYHAKQIHIDYTPTRSGARPIVLDDGLVFSTLGYKEVGSNDKGTHSTDDHAPYHHRGTLASLRALNVLHKPAWLINGGDAADFTSVCRHTKEQPGARENLRLRDDLASLRHLLDAQANVKTIKHKILIDSNHHEWVSNFVEENPALKGAYDWQTLAEELFPDWEVFIRTSGNNRIFMFGDYIIRHGDQENLRQGENMSPWGKYMCGHHHSYNAFRRAVSTGCGCGLGPKYIQNRVTSWISQVTSLTKYKGVAAVNPKIVLHDEKEKVSRFAYRDKIYEVEYYMQSTVRSKH